MKQPSEFTTEEVLLWLVAIGLGDKQGIFKENAVDGDMLVNLDEENFQADLGLTRLQAMKIVRSIQTSKELATGGGGDGGAAAAAAAQEISALQGQVQALQNENFALKAQLDELIKERRYLQQQQQQQYQPSYAPPPPTYAAPPPPQQQQPQNNGRPVIRGAAGGAAKGALLGAVAGAITGDAGQGAKVGAAVGATAGGLNGLGARRRARMGGRR